LHTSFKSVRFNLMVGIAGAVPDTKEDIRLGDVVVSKWTAGWPGVVQYNANGERGEDQLNRGKALDQATPLLLTAIHKAETAAIFSESHISQYISKVVENDRVTIVHPGPEQDVLFESNNDHTTVQSEDGGCGHCDPDKIRPRQPRKTQDPTVHYGRIASGYHLMRRGVTRDRLANEQGVVYFETAAAGLRDAAQYLVIRGICDYADSHNSKLWHPYAAAAAAYAKEVLRFIPTVPKTDLWQ
jgi:ankyrin repeat domain-containing protein 50